MCLWLQCLGPESGCSRIWTFLSVPDSDRSPDPTRPLQLIPIWWMKTISNHPRETTFISVKKNTLHDLKVIYWYSIQKYVSWYFLFSRMRVQSHPWEQIWSGSVLNGPNPPTLTLCFYFLTTGRCPLEIYFNFTFLQQRFWKKETVLRILISISFSDLYPQATLMRK